MMPESCGCYCACERAMSDGIHFCALHAAALETAAKLAAAENALVELMVRAAKAEAAHDAPWGASPPKEGA